VKDLIPQISIVIRAKNEEHFIERVLSTIFIQEIELPFEVIVIDSGSTDRTLEIVRQFNVRLYEIQASQFTFGYALNYGAQLARGEYLINLSAHCIPVDTKWMGNLLHPLLNDASITATYGQQLPIKGLNPFEERLTIAAFSPNADGKIKAIFSNSNCAIRKCVWEKYPFDEKATFAEDFIWAERLPSEYKIKYVPDAGVFHTHPLSFNYWAKRYFNNGVVDQYLEYVYGLKYPWRSQGYTYKGRYILAKQIVRGGKLAIRSYMIELFAVMAFLLKHKYFGYIPVFPIYLVLKRYYYRKGINEGRKRYKSSQVQR
jgi:glycosyltransferase involved in cell wall biosynthesis